MPRRSREEEEGAYHHAWAHAIRSEALFRDVIDRRLYLSLVERTVVDLGWRVLAYCQMTTHVHLLVRTPEANLGDGLEFLHGQYAQRFNRRHGVRGHVFERRYGSRRQRTDGQVLTTARYIARNPVEAGMVSAPEEWLWGSHRAVLLGAPPEWLDVDGLLGFFAALGGSPVDRYRQLIEAA